MGAILLDRLVPDARSVTRYRSYLVGDVSSMQKLAARRQELRRGSLAIVMLQSNSLWCDPTGDGTSLPEHYVSIEDLEYPYEGDIEKVRIVAFSLGNSEERVPTLHQYSRIAWEIIVVEFERQCICTTTCQNEMAMGRPTKVIHHDADLGPVATSTNPHSVHALPTLLGASESAV